MHQAFYDSEQQVVWVVRDQAGERVVSHSRDGVPSQDEAAAQLLRWGFWMNRWEGRASGLGYRTSPRLEAIGVQHASPVG